MHCAKVFCLTHSLKVIHFTLNWHYVLYLSETCSAFLARSNHVGNYCFSSIFTSYQFVCLKAERNAENRSRRRKKSKITLHGGVVFPPAIAQVDKYLPASRHNLIVGLICKNKRNVSFRHPVQESLLRTLQVQSFKIINCLFDRQLFELPGYSVCNTWSLDCRFVSRRDRNLGHSVDQHICAPWRLRWKGSASLTVHFRSDS